MTGACVDEKYDVIRKRNYAPSTRLRKSACGPEMYMLMYEEKVSVGNLRYVSSHFAKFKK